MRWVRPGELVMIGISGRGAAAATAVRPETVIMVAAGRPLPMISISGPGTVSATVLRPDTVIMGGGAA